MFIGLDKIDGSPVYINVNKISAIEDDNKRKGICNVWMQGAEEVWCIHGSALNVMKAAEKEYENKRSS